MTKRKQAAAPIEEVGFAFGDEITLGGDDISLGGDEISLGGDDAETEAPPTVAEAEAEAEAELSEVLAGFKERAKREESRVENATDSEYWFCLCFQTRDQKDEFLRKMGWWEIGDKYLDGMEVAHALGIRLEADVPPMPQLRIDRRLAALADDIDGQGVPAE